ncbi:MAG TPA: hypothetical protein VMT73_05960, partial [Anaerolineales bacterium]|nr:hypothetical protein [Anaerolineales bacterium]
MPGGVQGYHRYAYVNNNPVRYNDPTGHRLTQCGQDGSECGGGSGGGNGGGGGWQKPQRDDSTNWLTWIWNNYQQGWGNFNSAWSIYTNPNASILERMGARYYMGAWGSAHLMLAGGVTMLTYGAIVPAGEACAMNASCEDEVGQA